MDVFFTEIVLSLVSIVFNRNHGSTPFKFITLYFISSRQRWAQTEAVSSLFTGQSSPRKSQLPFPSSGFGVLGLHGAPCTRSQLTVPPGTAILRVVNKSWGHCSKQMKATYVTRQMQNIYPILKCKRHREQQERDWQVSHPPAQGAQAAPEAQRHPLGHWESTPVLGSESWQWGTRSLRQEQSHTYGHSEAGSSQGWHRAPAENHPANLAAAAVLKRVSAKIKSRFEWRNSCLGNLYVTAMCE